jgi:hypothetical protein
MVSSTRKMTVADCTRPEASLIGGSGCRWLIHEGEWARPFGSAQRGTRWTGGALTSEQRRWQRVEGKASRVAWM